MYKIWRSIYSYFAPEPISDLDEETCHADEVYTDSVLQEIADNGYNGIWVHAFMHHLAPAAPMEVLAPHAESHQKHLHTLCARAAKHGIKVFLYTQPMRAISKDDHEFWDRFQADFGGSDFRSSRALCISRPNVRKWLEDQSEAVAAALPELGGLILITASEYASHCYNAWQRKDDPEYPIPCPRCGEREPDEVVADVLNAVRNGIRRKSSAMEIIAWNWSWDLWRLKSPYEGILNRLPSDITIMADFERVGVLDLWNHPQQKIHEYCLSYAGPSEGCRNVVKYAQSRGMKTMVKLQLGTTHELASVVSLPLLTNIYKKISGCREMKIDGFMGCWNFGSFYSANTAGAEYFLSDRCPDNEEEAMRGFIRSYFGTECDVAAVSQAYKKMTDAMFYFPFSNMFIYNGPINYALAYSEVYRPGPLKGKSCGPSHLHVAERGDNLKYVFDYADMGYQPYDCFTLKEVLEMLPKLTAAWNEAAQDLSDAFRDSHCRNAELEANNALLVGKVWESTLHAFQSYALRLEWTPDKMPELRQILAEETALCRSSLSLLEKDPRQGWHGEAHCYLFSTELILKKLETLASFSKMEE